MQAVGEGAPKFKCSRHLNAEGNQAVHNASDADTLIFKDRGLAGDLLWPPAPVMQSEEATILRKYR